MELINELRIGNTVSVDGLFITVESINSEGINIFVDDDVLIEYASFGDDDYHVKPIELTEEWHNKFGVKVNGHMSFVYELPRKQTIYLAIVFTGDYVYLRQGKEPKEFEMVSVWNKDLMKRDMFVHELQNLYFALTGEELTVTNNG